MVNNFFHLLLCLFCISAFAENPYQGRNDGGRGNPPHSYIKEQNNLKKVRWSAHDTPPSIDHKEKIDANLIDGVNFFKAGDYKRAVENLKPFAVRDQVDSQYLLGLVYANGGSGVKRDYHESEKWLFKATQNGDLDAGKELKKIQVLIRKEQERLALDQRLEKQKIEEEVSWEASRIALEKSFKEKEQLKEQAFTELVFIFFFLSFIAMIIAGATKKIVIYYDIKDFFISLVGFGLILALLTYYQDTDFESLSRVQMFFWGASLTGTGLFFIQSIKSSIQHNRSIVLGGIVGIFKMLMAFVGVISLLGLIGKIFGIGEDESHSPSFGAFLGLAIVLILFVWLLKSLINGEQVYLTKGWTVKANEI